jgi:hypothetical protein
VKKLKKIINQCEQVLNNKSNTIRQIAHLFGLFTSSYRAINLGTLFNRYLERDKVHALAKSKNNFDEKIFLSPETSSDILWWKEKIAEQNGKDIRPFFRDGCLQFWLGSKFKWQNYRWSLVRV